MATAAAHGDRRGDDTAFRHDPPRLAVTGGIGSGKSTALAYLAELGAATLSSDQIVHEVYAAPEIVAALERRFGPHVILAGQVNRIALSNAVFEDREALRWLEHLAHPLVRRRIEEWMEERGQVSPRPALLAVEVPLLFESGRIVELFDCVLTVTAPKDVRRHRLAAKMTATEFDRRADRQLSEDEKVERSQFVYFNTGPRGRLKDYLAETYASILACAAAGAGEGVDGTSGAAGSDTLRGPA